MCKKKFNRITEKGIDGKKDNITNIPDKSQDDEDDDDYDSEISGAQVYVCSICFDPLIDEAATFIREYVPAHDRCL